MKKYNYVYKITNTINGKIYIGKHSTDDINDGYMGSGIRVKRAYQKYGLENFNKEVILFYTSEEELNQGEIFYIAQFNSTNPEIGYNLTYGGDGGTPTEEVRKKLSEVMKGENNPMYGRHFQHSEATKQKMSQTRKGRHLTEEHRRKLSEAKKGENNPMYGRHFQHSEATKQKMKGRIPWNKGKKILINKINQL